MRQTKIVLFSLALVCAPLLLSLQPKSQAAAGTAFFVSLSGSDDNPGTIERPFASLERARDAIRELKRRGSLQPGKVQVLLRGGSYPLPRRFELDENDSGTADSPVVYRPYRNEEVHLSGGKRLTGFSGVKDASILERLPAKARGHVLQADLNAQGIRDFGELKQRGFDLFGVPAALELFFNGHPMTLARWPDAGWAKVVATPDGENGLRFRYQGERPAAWSKADDIWLHGYWHWDWSDAHLKVASIDTRSHEIKVQGPPPEFGFNPGARYYALNLLEELDQPGEWYLDRKSGILYFWPPTPLSGGSAEVSLLPTMISLTNASYVTIQGMTLECCRATAVMVSGGKNNRVAGCTIRNVGNAAVDIEGSIDSGVVGCDIYNCGECGIRLSGGNRKTLSTGGLYAENNRVHDFSRWVRSYAPGIAIDGVGNRISHNLIYAAPHSAIVLHGNEHLIEYNEIHHVCQDTSDAGAFYMGRDYSERGNILRFNYFHDLGLGDIQAIYLDDFTSGTMVFGNVVYRAGRGIQLGGGRDNTVENNIFIDCQKPSFLDSRGTTWYRKYFDGTDITLTERLKLVNHRKPPYSTRYPELVTLYDRNPALPEGNAFIRNINVGGPWLELKDGVDKLVRLEGNLVGGDPGFVDRAQGNFQLKKNAPALRQGFRRIPMERIGLYRDEFRK